MSQQNTLDLQGNFRTHPIAEIMAEVSQAKLSGSLRISNEDRKTMIYFDEGEINFAVTNQRSFRLFEILFAQNQIDPETRAQSIKFANDLGFAMMLVEQKKFSKEEIDAFFKLQIEAILSNVFDWEEGDWTFSPLARLKEGIRFQISTNRLLIEYARSLGTADIAQRFRSFQETFALPPDTTPDFDLQPREAFLLTRFTGKPLKLEEIKALSGLPDDETLLAVYTLWLAGMLSRSDWNPAFTDRKIAAIRSAAMLLTKKAAEQKIEKPVAETLTETPVEPRMSEEPVEEIIIEEISLEQYLARVEKAQSHYEILGIEPASRITVVKKSYFTLAKMFHPDKFHREDPELLRRVEHAFTELAHAHETLKNEESRSAYDFKLRRDQEERQKYAKASEASEEPVANNAQGRQASEDFDRGFTLQLEGEFEAAIPFLARAVYYSPQNARYHAYFGKALSVDEAQRHKAEGEMQTAIRLDPENPSYRIMLTEFFIRNRLFKRAEGELTRLLAKFPDNKEAKTLLDSLQGK